MRGLLVIWVAALVLAIAPAAQASGATEARAGELDLSAWDFERDGLVGLDGDWQFVAGRLLAPQEPWPADATLLRVPGSWKPITGSGLGMGTYRLRVACRASEPLVLAVPFQQDAAAIFVNGRAVGRQGHPGPRDAGHDPAIGHQNISLAGLNCPLDIVVQMSNFEFYRGGLLRSMQLGTAAQQAERRDIAFIRGLLSVGAVGVVGVFALFFYGVRRRERVGLFFGLFCINSAVSLGLAGDRVLQPLVAGLPFEWHAKLLLGNWFIGLMVYPMLLMDLFPRQAKPRVTAFLVSFNGAGVLLCLLTPARIFGQTGPLLQLAAAAVAAYVIWSALLACVQRERGAPILLLGVLVMFFASLHDIVFYQHLLAATALPYGIAAIVLTPALLLAQRMARALSVEELRALEQRGRADLLVRATQAGVLDWNAVTGAVELSERYLEMLGLPTAAGAAAPPAFQEMVHPDDRVRIHESFLAQLRDRGTRSGLRRGEPADYRMVRADGAIIWVHAEAISVCDADGRTLRYVCTFIDITHLKAIEHALATERERLGLLVRSTKAGFGDWDAVRDTITYTDRFKQMLGYPAGYDTAQWPSLFDMMHPEDRERARSQFRDMIRRKPVGGEQTPGEPMSYRLRRADGKYIWIHAEGISQVDQSGRTRRFITSYLDVTHFHEQEEALRRSRDQIAAQAELLERQNEALHENVRLREEVERIGRHDIKTPLNSIVAVPRLLREERRLGPEADELLGIVERAGYRILSMVNLSLDLYKMEQGTYVFRPDAVDLTDLAGKVIADVRTHAASKGVTVRQVMRRIPYAWAEELLCYSLLANLLKNAVEASPEGAEVWLRPEVRDGTVVLSIHNQGAVPKAIRANFFQKYASLGKASGTGLGTYSARLMARVQDGDVDMETSDGAGTTLTITLRAAPEGAMPATARHAAERRGVEPSLISALPPTRVLLVDDDEYNLLIVRRFLPAPPFTVDTAINGRVAIAAAQAHWPDLVFMDLDMPVMGGLQAVGELRALQRARGGVPCRIVALSSHDDEETRRTALAQGFDRYLTKPVTREVIQEALLALCAPAAAIASPDGAHPSAPPLAAAPAGRDDPIVVDADVQPVLARFIASRRDLIAGMASAVGAADRGEVRRIAHQLAGSFGLYGFAWASQQARWIERNCALVEDERLHAMAGELRTHLDTAQLRTVHGAIIETIVEPHRGDSP